MSRLYEFAVLVLLGIASYDAAENGGTDATWIAGCAIAVATLGLVREHRADRRAVETAPHLPVILTPEDHPLDGMWDDQAPEPEPEEAEAQSL